MKNLVSFFRGIYSIKLYSDCVFHILGSDSQREGTAKILLCVETTL